MAQHGFYKSYTDSPTIFRLYFVLFFHCFKISAFPWPEMVLGLFSSFFCFYLNRKYVCCCLQFSTVVMELHMFETLKIIISPLPQTAPTTKQNINNNCNIYIHFARVHFNRFGHLLSHRYICLSIFGVCFGREARGLYGFIFYDDRSSI